MSASRTAEEEALADFCRVTETDAADAGVRAFLASHAWNAEVSDSGKGKAAEGAGGKEASSMSPFDVAYINAV